MMGVLFFSLQEIPAPAAPNLILGVILLIIGVVVVSQRERIYRATVRAEMRSFGRGLSELLERLQSAFWVGVAGGFGVLMGAVMIGYAVWRFLSSTGL